MPAFGLRDSSAGTPGVTVNPPLSVATSAPVVIVTVRDPGTAAGSTRMLTDAEVLLLTVMLLTVMPGPKFDVVVPCAQFVNRPVRFTDVKASAWTSVNLT